MKITSIDLMALAPDRGNGSRPIIVRINTASGLSGYGEAGIAIGTGAPACFALLKDFAPMLIGMDANANEVIWDKIFKASFWGVGNGGVIMSAISAIDCAVWDLKAKAANLPLYKLLGGKHRDKLWCYASQLQFGWDTDSFNPAQAASGDPSFYADAARKALAQGYTAVKANFIRYDAQGKILPPQATTGRLSRELMKLAEARLAAVRDAVGPDVELIAENHAMTDAATAIQFARMAEQFDIMFLEEPTIPLNPAVMKKIADSTSIPIATGERTYTRWGFLPFLESGCLTVIQPDIGNCGGITEGKKICDMAHIYDVGVQTHVCSSPVNLAVSIHLEAAIPNFTIHEHHIGSTLPSCVEMGKYDYQPKNGYMEIPELPGIGQEVSEQALKTAHIETITGR